VSPDADLVISIDDVIAGDNIVNAAEQSTVSVSGGSNAPEGTEITVTISDEDGATADVVVTALVDANGKWELSGEQLADVSSLDNGILTVTASGTGLESATTTIEKDTAGFDVSTIGTPAVIDPATGLPVTDPTSVTEPVVRVTLPDGVEAGDVVEVLDNGEVVGTYVVTEDDENNAPVSKDIPVELEDGTHVITVDVTDNAGNPSTGTPESVTVNVDGVAPVVTIDTIAGDDVINASEEETVTISGTVDEAATITVTIDDNNPNTNPVVVTVTPSEAGTWSIDNVDVSTLDDGDLTVSVDAVDGTGNATETPVVSVVQKDTVASEVDPVGPTSPVDGEGEFNLVDDNGDTITDGSTTDDAQPTLIVKVPNDMEVGDTINIYDGDDLIKSYELTEDDLTGDRVVSVDLPIFADDSTPSIDVAFGDDAGNETPRVDVADFTVDTTVDPAPDYIIAIDDTLVGDNMINESEQGSVAVTGTTNAPNDTVLTVTLTDENDATIQRDVTVTNGVWSVDPAFDTSDLADGEITIDVVGADTSATSTLDKDTVSPEGPIVPVSPNDPTNPGEYRLVDDEAGTPITTDTVTDDATPTVEMVLPTNTEAGDTINVYDNGELVDTYVVTEDDITDGEVSFEIAPLSEGGHLIALEVVDPAGNTSGTGAPVNFSVSPAASTVATIDATLMEDNIINENEEADVIISGSSNADEGTALVVTITDGTDSISQTAYVDGNGKWELKGEEILNVSSLDDGELTVTVNAAGVIGDSATLTKDTAGVNTSEVTPSDDATLTPGEFKIVDDNGDQIGDGDDTNDATPSVVIVLPDEEPLPQVGDIINIYEGDEIIATHTLTQDDIDANPQEVTIPLDLEDGNHDISIGFEDIAGNVTKGSDSISINVDGIAPVVTIDTIAGDDVINASEDDSVVISGTTEANASVTVTIADSDGDPANDVTATVTADANGVWTTLGLDLTGLNDGDLTVSAVATDSASNSSDPVVSLVEKDTVASDTDPNKSNDGTIDSEGEFKLVDDNGDVIGATTSDVTPTLIVKLPNDLQVGDSVNIYDNGSAEPIYTHTITEDDLAGDKVVSIDLPILADGPHNVDVSFADDAGNETTKVDVQEFTVDNPENVYTIVIDDTLVGDNMINESEASSVVISGETNIPQGTDLTVVITDTNGSPDNDITVTVTVEANGTWTTAGLDLTGLVDGDITVTVSGEDVDASTTLDKDTVSPEGPIVPVSPDAPDAAGEYRLVDDITGDAITTDTITDDATPTVEMVLPTNTEAGDTINVYDNGELVDTYVVTQEDINNSPTPVSFEIAPLSEGGHSIALEVVDPAGNSTGIGTPVNFSVSPAASTVATIDATLMEDNIINENEEADVIISGSSNADEGTALVVTITDGTDSISQTAYVDGNGKWELKGEEILNVSSLDDGELTVTVNAAGVIGDSATLTKDTIVVSVDPEINDDDTFDVGEFRILDNVGDSTGELADGSVTDDLVPTIEYKLTPDTLAGDIINIYDGETIIGTHEVNDADIVSGVVSIEPDTPFINGTEHAISIEITDDAGNSARSDAVNIETNFIAVTIDNIALSDDSGRDTTDSITNVQAQTISATLSQALMDGETLYGSVDGGANWHAVTVTDGATAVAWATNLTPGENEIMFEVRNQHSEVGERATLEYELDMVIDPLTVTNLDFSADTGDADDFITTEPNQTVTFDVSRLPSSELAEIAYYSVDGGNSWTEFDVTSLNVSVPMTLQAGENQYIEIKYEDDAGNIAYSAEFHYTLDAADRLDGLTPTLDDTPVDLTVETEGEFIIIDNSDIGNQTPILEGTQTIDATPVIRYNLPADLIAGDTVNIYDGGTLITSHTLDADDITNGAVDINLDNSLSRESHSLSMNVTSVSGLTSPTSTPITFEVLVDAPDQTIDSIDILQDTGRDADDFNTNIKTQTITANINGALDAGDIVLGSVDGGVSWTDLTTAGFVSGQTITWTNVNLEDGSNSIQFKVRDNENYEGAVATQSYVLDQASPDHIVNNIRLQLDTGVDTTDGETNIAHQNVFADLNKVLETGEKLFVKLNNGDWEEVPNQIVIGTEVAALVELVEGENTVSFKVEDAAGNESSVYSENFTLDTQDPTAGIQSVTLSADEGFEDDDYITNEPTQTVTITLTEAIDTDAEKVYMRIDDDTWTDISGFIQPDNTTVIIPNVTLLPGTHIVDLKVEDLAGNDGVVSQFTYQLDTTAPTHIVSHIDISHDTSIDGDFNTSVENQTITAQISDPLTTNEKLWISVDGGTTWTDVTTSVTGTSVSYNTDLNEGSSAIQFRVEDRAGNYGQIGEHVYTLDMTTPTQTISNVSISDDNGFSDSDFITNSATQTVTATLSDPLVGDDRVFARVDGQDWIDVTDYVTGTTLSWTDAVLEEGVHNLELKVEDLAGNTIEANHFSTEYELDLDAPIQVLSNIDLEVDTGDFDDDFITNIADQAVTVQISSNPGVDEKVYGSIDGGNSWTDVTGMINNGIITWIPTGGLLSGENEIQFKIQDRAGNEASLITQGYNVDTTVPPHTISGIEILYDTGASDSDFVTNVKNQTITATLSETLTSTDQVYARVDGGEWVNITTSVTGTAIAWQNVELSEGTHDIEIKVKDLAGNENINNVASQEYTLNTSSAPSQVIDDIFISHDSNINGDFNTNVQLQNITASISAPLDEHSTLQGSVDGGQTWTDITAHVTGTAVTWPVNLENGSNSIQMKVVDQFNNDGHTTVQEYVLDQSTPAQTIDNVVFSNDTGDSDSDLITNVATQNISAELSTPLAANDQVFARVNDLEWINITDSVTGTSINWESVTLSDGINNVEFKVKDIAGNENPDNVLSVEYHLDTTVPAQSVYNIALSDDNGVDANDFITNENTQTVTATLTNTLGDGEILRGSVDGGTTWTDISVADGSTAVSWTTSLIDGDNTLVLQVFDLAGNEGPSVEQTYTIDKTAPTQTISDVSLSNDTGESDSDLITKEASQTISATLSEALGANEHVVARVDGGAWIDITAHVSGTTITWPNVMLSEGVNNIELKVQDTAGNDSTPSVTEYELDVTDPTVGVSNIDISLDTHIDGDFITKEADQTITATLSTPLTNGEKVYGSVDGGATWEAIAVADGETAVNWNTQLDNGSNSIQLKVVDIAGNDTTPVSQNYVLDTQAPTQTISNIDIAYDTNIDGDFVTSTQRQNITATLSDPLEENDRLLARVDGGDWLDVTYIVTDTAINWQNVDLANGSNRIEFKVQDYAGNDGAIGFENYLLDMDTPPSVVSNIEISDDTNVDGDFNTSTQAQTITADIAPTTLGQGDMLFASVDGGSTWTNISANISNGVITWATNLIEGENSIVFKVEDLAGNRTDYFTQEYILDTQAPTPIISNITLSDDNGVYNDDRVTSTPMQNIGATLSEELHSNDNLFARVDGGQWVDITNFVTGTTVNWTNVALIDGDGQIEMKIMDGAGNNGDSQSVSYRLDQNAYVAVTLDDTPTDMTPETAGEFVVINDVTNSAITQGELSNDDTPTVSVKLPDGMVAGEIIRVYDNAGFEPIAEYSVTQDDTDNGAIANIVLPDLVDGSHSLTIATEDLAGNVSELSSPFAFTVDTQAPTTVVTNIEISADSGIDDDDFITNVETQDITGTLSAELVAGESVVYRVDGGEWLAVTSVTGTAVSVTGVNLLSGENRAIEFAVVDASENIGTVRSQAYTFDNTPFDVTPTRSTDSVVDSDGEFILIDDAGADTGEIGNGNDTDDSTPILSIKIPDGLVAGSIIHVYDNDSAEPVESYQITADDLLGDRIVNIEFATPFAMGQHDIDITFEDIAGNETAKDAGDNNYQFNVTVDSPHQYITEISLSHDTGLYDDDFVTKTQNQTITATLSDDLTPGDTVLARVDGGDWIDVTSFLVNRTVTWTNVNLLHGDGHQIEFIVADENNNRGIATREDYILDIVAPTITIDSTLSGDNYVNDSEKSTLVVSGTSDAEEGSVVTVTLSDGTNSIEREASVENDGTWRLTGDELADLTGFSDGDIDITASTVDLAGNQSSDAEKTIELDTVSDDVIWQLNTEDAVITPSVIKLKDNNLFIEVGDGANQMETTSTFMYSYDGGTNWHQGSNEITDGKRFFAVPHNSSYDMSDIVVKSTDIAGNETTYQTPAGIELVFDGIADDFTSELTEDTAGSHVGADGDSDQITQNGEVTVTGIEATSTLEYRLKDYVTGTWSGWTEITHNEGTGTFTVPEGKYEVVVRTTDEVGNELEQSMGDVVVDTESATKPQFVKLIDDEEQAQTIDLPSVDPIKIDDKTMTLEVQVDRVGAGDAIEITVHDGTTPRTQLYVLTQADVENSLASITLEEDKFPTDTGYTITTKVIDVAGNESVVSDPLSLTIDTVADEPSAVYIHEDTYGEHMVNGVVATNGDSDQITMNGRINIEGLEAASSWMWRAHDQDTWHLVTNPIVAGESFVVLPELNNGYSGYENLQIRTVDDAGNASQTHYIGTFVVDQTADDYTLALNEDTYGEHMVNGFVADNGASDQVTQDGTILVAGVTDTNSVWYYRHDGMADWEIGYPATSFTLAEGTYTNVRVLSVDVAGNEMEQNFGTVVVDNTVDDFVAGLDDDTFGSHVTDGDSDQISSNVQVNVTGVTDTNSVWYYKHDGMADWQIMPVDATSFTLPSTLGQEITYTNVMIKSVDHAGNESTQNLGTIVADRKVDDFTVNLVDDTYGDHMVDGTVATNGNVDQVTSNGEVRVSGVTDTGSVWYYKYEGDAASTSLFGHTTSNGDASSWGTVTGDIREVTNNGVTATITGYNAADEIMATTYNNNGSAYGIGIAGISNEIDKNETLKVEFDQTLSSVTLGLTSLYGMFEEGTEYNGRVYWEAYNSANELIASGEKHYDVFDNDGDQTQDTTYIEINGEIARVELTTLTDNEQNANFLLSHIQTTRMIQDDQNDWIMGSGDTFVLAEGEYDNVMVRSVDIAGNTTITNFGSVTVDQTADDFDAELVTDTRGPDTGSVIDKISQDITVRVNNITEDDTVWYYKYDGIDWVLGDQETYMVTMADDGVYENFMIKSVDIAGNIQTQNLGRLEKDTVYDNFSTAFDDTTGGHASPGDQITNDNTISIVGVESTAAWYYRFNGSDWQLGGHGEGILQLDIDINAEQVTYNDIEIKTIDIAGNESPVTDLGDWQIDSKRDAFNWQLEEDTFVPGIGTGTDQITSNGTIIVSDVDATSKWFIKYDGQADWIEGSGDRITLEEGTYTNTQLMTEDRVGNLAYQNLGTIVIDQTADEFTYNAVDTYGAHVTGGATDHITNDRFIEINDVENTSRVYMIHDGLADWQASPSLGNAVFTFDGNDTSYTNIRFKTIDIAGNETDVTNIGDWTFDILTDAHHVQLEEDTGSSDSDLVTSNGNIEINGIENTSQYFLSINGGATWVAASDLLSQSYVTNISANSVNPGETNYTVTLVAGEYDIVTRTVDIANNSTTRTLGHVEIDQTPDNFIASLDDTAGGTGTTNDGYTRDDTVEISGLEASSDWYIAYTRSGNYVDFQKVTGNSFTLTGSGEWYEDISVYSVDEAGNQSAVSNIGSFFVDIYGDYFRDYLVNDTAGGTGTTTDNKSMDGTYRVDGIDSSTAISYSLNGGVSWNTLTNVGGGSHEFVMSEGTYNNVLVRTVDYVGNTITENVGNYVIDQTDDTFSVLRDGRNFEISNVESTSHFRYSTDYGSTWNMALKIGGNYYFDVSGGSHPAGQIQFKTVDHVGNELITSQPAFNAGDPFTASVNSTNTNTPVFSGYADPGSTVSVTGPGATYSDTADETSGYWSVSGWNLGSRSSGWYNFTATGTGTDGITRSHLFSVYGHDPIAALEDGGYIVTWISDSRTDERDDDGFGVFAQRYNADGSLYGASFLVNTTTANDQINSDVIGLSDGGYVVVWQSAEQDGSGFGIYSQRYDVDNNMVGGEVLVNESTETNQMNPEIEALDNGGYVVVWQSAHADENGLNDIYVQVFDANGERVSSETLVNTLTLDDQQTPNITTLNNGNFVIVWQSLDPETGVFDVRSQTFTSSGETIGDEVVISKDLTTDYSSPYVATLSDGSYVISWLEYSDTRRSVFVQRYNADGTVASDATMIEEFVGDSTTAEVSEFNTGFSVAMKDDDDIKVKFFDTDMEETHTEVVISETDKELIEPHMTTLNDGKLLVTWTEVSENGNMAVHGQRIETDGTLDGDVFEVGQVTYEDPSVLYIESEYADIDFDALANANSGIETIDLSAGSYNINDVTLEDVLTITDDSNELVFVGDDGDTIDLANNDDWEKSAENTTVEGHDGEFAEYTHKNDPTAKLFVDEDVSVI
jgi:hypothetical protein